MRVRTAVFGTARAALRSRPVASLVLRSFGVDEARASRTDPVARRRGRRPTSSGADGLAIGASGASLVA